MAAQEMPTYKYKDYNISWHHERHGSVGWFATGWKERPHIPGHPKLKRIGPYATSQIAQEAWNNWKPR